METFIKDIDQLFSKHLTYSLKDLKRQAEFSQNQNLIAVLNCLESFSYENKGRNQNDSPSNFAQWLSHSLNELTKGFGFNESDSHYKNISDCISNVLEEAIVSENLFLNQNLSSKRKYFLMHFENKSSIKKEKMHMIYLVG